VILEKVMAVLKKDAISAARYRNGIVFTLLAQAAQFAAFYYLARSVGPQFRPEGIPYFLFLVIGTGFYTFLLAGIHSFLRTIQESQQTGTLEALLTTSTSPPVLVGLSAMSAFATGIVQLLIYVGAGLYFFAPIQHVAAADCILILVLSVFITIAIGLYAAGLQISIYKGAAVLWLFGSGAWLLSGTLFPINALPRALRLVSLCIPFTHSLYGMRLALIGGNAPELSHEIVVLAAFTLALVPTSIWFFSWTVKQARQNGTLSFY
jgi:ABC-type polysaccharide/polyol phosphate export permease